MYVFVPLHTGSAPTTGPVGVTGSPQESMTFGGVGTTCASLIHATVALPGAGSVNVVGCTVYVNIQSCAEPVQSVYVHVYVLVPPHTGSGPATGPVGEIGVPHELVTTGGEGTTCASATQGTVEEPGAGKVNVGGLMVYVYTHCDAAPVQSVYVNVYVLGPEHAGSAPSTGPVIVSGSPQLLFTTGGVGTTCASLIQATVDDPGAGIVTVGGLTV